MAGKYRRDEVGWIKYYRNGKSYQETLKTTDESEACISMLKENKVCKGFFEHGAFLKLRDARPDYL